MEAPSGVTAVRGVSLPMQSSRKEWRAVSEHNSGNEELNRSKLGLSDERLIFEVQQPGDVTFCSITMDATLENELQQRLHTVCRQREELQQIETELRAEFLARSHIIALQNTYDSQIKEHVNANVKLQEQLRESKQSVHDLGREIEEKERELHAIRLETEAVWAKDDLLREQNKELATFRRERDNAEAERAQHLKQIHDLQEHIQEKERQLMELQEQHKVVQETVIFKDEQLREAQTWITRAQEMDALQTSTNQTLQAELRERIEQYTQLWMNCQRQFTEFVHTIQALQIELADVREKSGIYAEESRSSQPNLKDALQSGSNHKSHLDVSGNAQVHVSSSLPNGKSDNDSSSMSQANSSGQVGQTNHVAAIPVVPQSLVRMPAYLPGQVAALHPLIMHQQAVPQSVPSHAPHSHTGHFHSVPALSTLQHWQSQQVASEGSQVPQHNYKTQLQNEQNLLKAENIHGHEVPVNGKPSPQKYINAQMNQGLEPHAVVPTPNEGSQVLGYFIDPQSQSNLQQLPLEFQEGLRLDSLKHDRESEKKISTGRNTEAQLSRTELPRSSARISEDPMSKTVERTTITSNATSPSEVSVSDEETTKLLTGKSSEVTLLDKGSLLRCIVRTIPPNGKIRISSTLPNRLGKMLSPLHWHDYKKYYGKLDDLVASHPELFVIEGDFIQLREGAQEIIAATAAFAQVQAAASATTSYSSLLPSVAVTPMAQPHRLKREHVTSQQGNLTDNHSQRLMMQTQHINGVPYAVEDVSTVKILSKSKDLVELSSSEIRPQLTMQFTTGNGATISQIRGVVHSQANANCVVKEQGRTTGAPSNTRR